MVKLHTEIIAFVQEANKIINTRWGHKVEYLGAFAKSQTARVDKSACTGRVLVKFYIAVFSKIFVQKNSVFIKTRQE